MSYDDWKTDAPEDDREAPIPCPVCTGAEDAMPCGEDCAAIYAEVIAHRCIRSLYRTIRHAMNVARVYAEEGSDRRVRDVVVQIKEYRSRIAGYRQILRRAS